MTADIHFSPLALTHALPFLPLLLFPIVSQTPF